LDDVLGDAGVDEPGADGVAELVSVDAHCLAGFVVHADYAVTWSGMVYVCFITDVFSRTIVGWTVAANMRTQMVLDTLEHARFNRGALLESLVCHSDAGSQFTSIRYGERLAELGAAPSIGTVGDCPTMPSRRRSTVSTRPS